MSWVVRIHACGIDGTVGAPCETLRDFPGSQLLLFDNLNSRGVEVRRNFEGERDRLPCCCSPMLSTPPSAPLSVLLLALFADLFSDMLPIDEPAVSGKGLRAWVDGKKSSGEEFDMGSGEVTIRSDDVTMGSGEEVTCLDDVTMGSGEVMTGSGEGAKRPSSYRGVCAGERPF